jgi:serine/threonine-protein kinase
MTANRQDRIERLVHEALARDPADRAAFLLTACGDDEALRCNVAALLQHDAAAEQFLQVPVLDVLAHVIAGDDVPAAAHTTPAAADTLAPGVRFGPYDVLSVIGVGGMGEVYRARDARLQRDVALKVLPERFSHDRERLARFEREAQVLASLSHPNIGAIHGIEHADGISALVLEIVEGPTLAERLDRGPLPLDDALQIAYQIADALEAAHERGIVHRDLKPANVIITREGQVKLLDFGVAKVFERHGVSEAPATPRRATEDTQPGLVPGTIAYMSPEQARGDVIDRRSDIWSFGCVLFEMLTGRSPFRGPGVSESLANVLHGEADFEALPAGTPAATRRLLRLCLERSLRGRLQHIGDARVDIGDLRSHRHERSSASRSVARTLGRTTLWVAGAAAILLAAAAGWFVAARGTTSGQVVRFRVTPSGAWQTPTARTVAISPDGSRFAYASEGWLWVRSLDAMDPVRMLGTEGAGGEPFFSPDGEWVAFFDVNTGLRKVRARGGAVSTIVVNAGRQLGGSWGANGSIVFADGVGLFTVSADGGAAHALARPAAERGETRYAWPQILPGGRRLLFTIQRDRIANADVAVLDLDTKQQTVLLRGAHAARYAPTGHLVYAAEGQLQAVRLDLDSLGVHGEPIVFPSVQMAETAGLTTADFDISQTGTLVYAAAAQPAHTMVTMVWVDRNGREDPVHGAAPGHFLYPRISPDGTRVALDVGGANRDIWVWNFEREVMTKITDGPTEDMMPAWSVDGKRIYFASDRDGVFNVFVRSADGSGPATRVYRGPDNHMPFSSPDAGRLLIFTQGPTAPSGDVSVLTLREPARIEPLISTAYREGNAQVSPDNRWVAYQSDESGRPEIYVSSFPSIDQQKEIVSRGGGTQPLWNRAGTELFYRSPDGAVRAVSIRVAPDLVVGPTTELFPNRGYASNPVASWAYAVSPKDGRFLMLKQQTPAEGRPIDVVVNWFDTWTWRTSTR